MNSPHLTADGLDTFLANTPSPSDTSHVATCPTCAAMIAGDRRLLAALAALPQFTATPEFSDRVMAKVTVARVPFGVAAGGRTSRSLAARRRAIGAALLVGGGVAAVSVWASAHPVEMLRWSTPALRGAGHALWLSLQTIVVNATEQPWFSSLRDTLDTPLRAFVMTAGLAGTYVIGLLGLRRLMNEPATNASW